MTISFIGGLNRSIGYPEKTTDLPRKYGRRNVYKDENKKMI
jgi:hypothetical protein